MRWLPLVTAGLTIRFSERYTKQANDHRLAQDAVGFATFVDSHASPSEAERTVEF